MPEFVWNETDFIECLSVLPEIDNAGAGYHFTVFRDGLRMLLSVQPYEAEVLVSLFRAGATDSLFTTWLTDCPGARYIQNRQCSCYLEFAAAKVFGRRYDGKSLIPMGLRLTVDPDFKIELFQT